MEAPKRPASRFATLVLAGLFAPACATTPAPTSPQEAYNQAVQKCETARSSSYGQPPAAVEAAFNACMAQAAPLSQ